MTQDPAVIYHLTSHPISDSFHLSVELLHWSLPWSPCFWLCPPFLTLPRCFTQIQKSKLNHLKIGSSYLCLKPLMNPYLTQSKSQGFLVASKSSADIYISDSTSFQFSPSLLIAMAFLLSKQQKEHPLSSRFLCSLFPFLGTAFFKVSPYIASSFLLISPWEC